MKKGIKVTLWIVCTIVVLTIASNLFFSRGDICTQMRCPCSLAIIVENFGESNYTGERPCNSCSSGKPLFVSILFNVVRQCEYKEIIMCEDGQEVGQRYDKENQKCRYDPYILVFNLRYLGNYFEMISQPAIQINGTSFPESEE